MRFRFVDTRNGLKMINQTTLSCINFVLKFPCPGGGAADATFWLLRQYALAARVKVQVL